VRICQCNVTWRAAGRRVSAAGEPVRSSNCRCGRGGRRHAVSRPRPQWQWQAGGNRVAPTGGCVEQNDRGATTPSRPMGSWRHFASAGCPGARASTSDRGKGVAAAVGQHLACAAGYNNNTSRVFLSTKYNFSQQHKQLYPFGNVVANVASCAGGGNVH
jgi:hypothetical protein